MAVVEDQTVGVIGHENHCHAELLAAGTAQAKPVNTESDIHCYTYIKQKMLVYLLLIHWYAFYMEIRWRHYIFYVLRPTDNVLFVSIIFRLKEGHPALGTEQAQSMKTT